MKTHYLLIDVSNSFTKVATATPGRMGKRWRLPTASLRVQELQAAVPDWMERGIVISSVVPQVTQRLRRGLGGDSVLVGPSTCGGLGIDYPRPSSIGGDRLANALACMTRHGAPSIVVDFGTAVTFDVISESGAYVGGVIAPGLNLMAEYLHSRTALLPLLKLRRPLRVVGRSTEEAMLAGAVHGYRGLVAEILRQIRAERFPKRRPVVVATGGDAALIGGALPLFDVIDPLLTLRGLQIVAARTWAATPPGQA